MNKEMAEKLAAITGKPVSEYFNEHNEGTRSQGSVETTVVQNATATRGDQSSGIPTDTHKASADSAENRSTAKRNCKIKNRNKSRNGELHKCDFCGISPEDIWSGAEVDGQYCFEHYREAHDNIEEFDQWYKRFNV